MEQLDVIREMIQKKIPDKKVRNVWFLSVDVQNNILYVYLAIIINSLLLLK